MYVRVCVRVFELSEDVCLCAYLAALCVYLTQNHALSRAKIELWGIGH